MRRFITGYQKELLQVATFTEKTVQNYTSCLISYDEYIRKQFAIDLLESKSSHVQAWLLQIKSKGVSKSRLQHHQSALKTFFSYLVKMNIMKENPAKHLPNIRRKRGERKPVAKDLVVKLLHSIDQTTWLGIRNYVIISIFWALGLRLNELTTLRVSDFEKDIIPGEKIGLLRVRGKNKKQRALFVVDTLYEKMIGYLIRPESPIEASKPIFSTINGAISGDRIQRMIKEYAQKAGITELITPHMLRHSFATEMYHQKVPLSALQAMMGHDSIEETSVYIHVSDQLQQQALEKISLTGGDLCL